MKPRVYCPIRQCRREITGSSCLVAILGIYHWLLNLYTVLSSNILNFQSDSLTDRPSEENAAPSRIEFRYKNTRVARLRVCPNAVFEPKTFDAQNPAFEFSTGAGTWFSGGCLELLDRT